jgi:hypothetical protein
VVLASRILPPGVKLVWCRDYWLDQGPDGAFMSAQRLANQLGMPVATVDTYRRFLVHAGLHVRGDRRDRIRPWFPVLPEGCHPSLRAGDDEIARCARVLDQHLERLKEEAATRTPSRAPPGRGSGNQQDGDLGVTRTGVLVAGEALGGLRGGPPTPKEAQASSSSGVTEREAKRSVATQRDAEEERKAREERVTTKAVRLYREKAVRTAQ